MKAGDVVYGTWGHRDHTVVTDDYAALRILPTGLDPILGIYSQMGAIALNGVHDAAMRIGETVAGFGLGVPGQIISSWPRSPGAGHRRGSHGTAPPRRPQSWRRRRGHRRAGGNVAEQVRELTNNLGADVCIEASGIPRLARGNSGRSLLVEGGCPGLLPGWRPGPLPRRGVPRQPCQRRLLANLRRTPDLSYRWNRVRLDTTVMRLQAEGVLNLRPLITHVIPFADAAEAFRLSDYEAEKTLQVVLDFTK